MKKHCPWDPPLQWEHLLKKPVNLKSRGFFDPSMFKAYCDLWGWDTAGTWEPQYCCQFYMSCYREGSRVAQTLPANTPQGLFLCVPACASHSGESLSRIGMDPERIPSPYTSLSFPHKNSLLFPSLQLFRAPGYASLCNLCHRTAGCSSVLI